MKMLSWMNSMYLSNCLENWITTTQLKLCIVGWYCQLSGGQRFLLSLQPTWWLQPYIFKLLAPGSKVTVWGFG